MLVHLLWWIAYAMTLSYIVYIFFLKFEIFVFAFLLGSTFKKYRQEGLAPCLWLLRFNEWTSNMSIYLGPFNRAGQWSWNHQLEWGRIKDGRPYSILHTWWTRRWECWAVVVLYFAINRLHLFTVSNWIGISHPTC